MFSRTWGHGSPPVTLPYRTMRTKAVEDTIRVNILGRLTPGPLPQDYSLIARKHVFCICMICLSGALLVLKVIWGRKIILQGNKLVQSDGREADMDHTFCDTCILQRSVYGCILYPSFLVCWIPYTLRGKCQPNVTSKHPFYFMSVVSAGSSCFTLHFRTSHLTGQERDLPCCRLS